MDREKLLFEMEHGQSHIIIDGSAGTGKTTLIRQFKERTNRKVVYLATTGIAAMLIGGTTIHGAFGFVPSVPLLHAVKNPFDNNGALLLADTILIDEVSMLNCALLDSIDIALRLHRQSSAPFGGVRLILVGDLYQLPPVVKTEDKPFLEQQSIFYKAPFAFFQSMSFQRPEVLVNLQVFSLTTNYRQSDDPVFADILLRARLGHIRKIDITRLNDHSDRFSADSDHAPVLCMTNEKAQEWNNFMMPSPEMTRFSFPQVSPATGLIELEVQQSPALEPVMLWPGAMVLHTVNDYDLNLRNGTLGKILDIRTSDGSNISSAIFQPEGRAPVEVGLHRFEVLKPMWDSTVKQVKHVCVASIDNIPFRLAYGLTIHKAQGQTMERAYLDKGAGAFTSAQMYTALSRVRRLRSLRSFSLITEDDFMVEPAVTQFLNMLDVKIVE